MDAHTVLEQIYRKHKDNLTHVAFKMCNDYEMARDIVQEALTQALISMKVSEDTIKIENCTFAYLKVLITNLILKSWRKEGTIKKYKNRVTEYLYANKETRESSIEYYPLSQKALEGVRQLKGVDKIAVMSFMNDVPLRWASKANSINDSHFYYRFGEALHTVKDYIATKGVKSPSDKKAAVMRSEKGDQMYLLREQGWTFKQIAEHLGTKPEIVKTSYYRRRKLMDKFPHLYKDLHPSN